MRCNKYGDEVIEGFRIFFLVSVYVVDIILGFVIYLLLFGVCGCVRLCFRVWGRFDCKLGGGGDGGGFVEFVKINRNVLNFVFFLLE